jgi:hypothetical protein
MHSVSQCLSDNGVPQLPRFFNILFRSAGWLLNAKQWDACAHLSSHRRLFRATGGLGWVPTSYRPRTPRSPTRSGVAMLPAVWAAIVCYCDI